MRKNTAVRSFVLPCDFVFNLRLNIVEILSLVDANTAALCSCSLRFISIEMGHLHVCYEGLVRR